MSMKQPIFFLIIVLLLLVPCLAQDVNTVKDKFLEKVIKKEGWKLPEVENKESYLSHDTKVENYPVTMRVFRFDKPAEMNWDFYALRAADNSLVITQTRTIEIRGLAVYIAEDRTFACRVVGVPMGILEKGFKVYIGVVLESYYVDEDGDGSFETRYMNQMPDKIPSWIPKDIYKFDTTPPPPIKSSSKPSNFEIEME